MHSNNRKIYVLIQIIFVLMMVIGNIQSSSASCQKDNMIKGQTDPGVLARMADSWKDLDGECHFSIGSAFMDFFQKNTDAAIKNSSLEYAKKYLLQAKNSLRPSRSEYKECHNFLITIEANSPNPDLQSIYESIQVRGVIENIQDTDRQLIGNAINSQIEPYTTSFAETSYPPEHITKIYQQLEPENYKNLKAIRAFKQNYQTIRNRLQQHTSQNILQDIADIIQALDQYDHKMPDIVPLIATYRLWLRSLQAMSTLPQGARQICSRTNELKANLETVRQTLSFAQTPQELNCRNQMACLVNLHSTQNILPVYNDPNRLQKKERCVAWISSYTFTINTCGIDYLIEDRRPFLNEVKALHDALDAYNTNNTRLLESIHTSTQNNEIKRISGQYLAHHYYTIVFDELQSGPINGDALGTLRNIGDTLNLYNRYSDYISSSGRLNINQQHRLLTNFFSNIFSNFDTAQGNVHYIDDRLKTVWNVQAVPTRVQRPIQQPPQRPVQQPPQRPVQQPPQRPVQQPPQRPVQQPPQRPAQQPADDLFQRARNAFDNSEYFTAWDYYGQAYQDIVPDRLENLVSQDETVLVNTPSNVWRTIAAEDKTRLKILSIIIKLINSRISPITEFRNLVTNRTTDYSPDYSFHLFERIHSVNEKTSDENFINALYYKKNANAQNQYSFKMIRSFLAAYQALEQGSSEFNIPTQQRVIKKKKRLEYWILKVWNEQDISWKAYARSQYYRFYPSIFDTLIRNNDNHNSSNSSADDPIVQNPDTGNATPIGDIFELFVEFAAICDSQGTNAITCEQMRVGYHTEIIGTDTDNCIEQYIRLIRTEYEHRFFSRFYFAWAKIRKGQNNPIDWVDNLALAYSRADTTLRENIKQSLVHAKRRLRNQRLNQEDLNRLQRARDKLQRYGLLEYWNNIPQSSTTQREQPSQNSQTHSQSINPEFNTLAEANRFLEQIRQNIIQCSNNRHSITTFINRLISRYAETYNRQFFIIYNRLKPHCRCISSSIMGGYDESFNEIQINQSSPQ